MGEINTGSMSHISAPAELSAILDAAVDAIVIINEHGDIMEFSPAAQRLFGYEADETIGQPVSILMPEPDRSAHASYMDHYLKTGMRKIIGIGREVQGLKRSGEIFPLWLSVGEAASEEGRHFVGILRDLTTEHTAEKQRHALESRLAQVGRFSLLGEMAAGIAHEINQPLSAIGTYAQAARRLMEAGDFDHDTLSKACHGIDEQVQRAGQVISNLRRLIHKQDVRKETLDLNDVINGAIGLVIADLKSAGIEITVKCGSNLPKIHGNAIQLQQVLLNLTHNAADAMRDLPEQNKLLSLTTRSLDEKHVQFIVGDRGPGVPPRLKDAIFNPFVTTKHDGLGIGLAISQTIVQLHAGELTCEDNPEGGADFVVTLPAYCGDSNE